MRPRAVPFAFAALAMAASPAAAQESDALRLRLDARLRYEVYDPTSFGRGPQDAGGYGLWRILPSIDWRPQTQWRLYGQAFSGGVIDRTGGARPNDRNDFDISQAFVEWRPAGASESFLRFGRQEIALGSGRILAANDGANVRRQFDGAFASFAQGDVTLLGVASGLVRVRPGVFDDSASLDRAMIGGGIVHRADDATSALYAIYAKRPESIFGSPAAPQERYTLGARIVRRGERADIEAEALAQGGEADGLDVRAWALAGEAGWGVKFAEGGALRFWLKASAASGDESATDSRLGGFDPLFSNPNYTGSFPIVGPTNVLAFNPGVTFETAGRMRVGLDVAVIDRLSESDAVYSFAGAALPGGAGGDSVGALWALTAAAPLREGVIFQATAARLDAGDYFTLRDADTTVLALNLIVAR